MEEWESDGEDDFETYDILSNPDTRIQDVWAHNFHEEMKKMMKLAERFNIIAMVRPLPARTRSSRASLPPVASWTSATTPSKNASTCW